MIIEDEFDEAFMEQIDHPTGETGLSHDVDVDLSNLIHRLEQRYNFKHGTVAAFYHMATVLSQHLEPGVLTRNTLKQ